MGLLHVLQNECSIDTIPVDVVMPIEFQIPNLCIQVREWLSEGQSEQIRLQQLLELGEARVHNKIGG